MTRGSGIAPVYGLAFAAVVALALSPWLILYPAVLWPLYRWSLRQWRRPNDSRSSGSVESRQTTGGVL